MLNELKSSTTLLQSYLTWGVNLSAGGAAAYILLLCFSLFLMVEFCEPREKNSSETVAAVLLGEHRIICF